MLEKDKGIITINYDCGCKFQHIIYFESGLRHETAEDFLKNRYGNFENINEQFINVKSCYYHKMQAILDTSVTVNNYMEDEKEKLQETLKKVNNNTYESKN